MDLGSACTWEPVVARPYSVPLHLSSQLFFVF